MAAAPEVVKANTREAFGKALLKLAREHAEVCAITADTAKSMHTTLMGAEFPDRVFDSGIAEQNMMMVASGLASTGKVVFAATYAVFTSMRALEQIRTFACYPKLDVKVVSGLAGLSGAQEGVTHQSVEDLAIMRSLPNMTVLVPADAIAVARAVEAAYAQHGPVYIRLARQPSPVIFDESYRLEIGKANLLAEHGRDLTIITCGLVVGRVLQAAAELAAAGTRVRVLEMPSLKPIDGAAVEQAARETGAILTVEEGNILGGLGGAVAEVIGETYPVPVHRIGIPDVFAESGEHEELLDRYGLSIADIKQGVADLLQKKARA